MRAVLQFSVKNDSLTPDGILKYCRTTEEASEFLKHETEKNDFSPRAVSSCLKVARTIADMVQCHIIEYEHIKEAVDLRKTDGGFCL